jgi:hypothetical protein
MEVNEYKILVRGQSSLPQNLEREKHYRVVDGIIAVKGERRKYNEDGTYDLIYEAGWFAPPTLEAEGVRLRTSKKGSPSQMNKWQMVDTQEILSANGESLAVNMDRDKFYEVMMQAIMKNHVDIFYKYVKPYFENND